MEQLPLTTTAIPEPDTYLLDTVRMTVQNRVRFEIFVTIGHVGTSFEFLCHSQAPWEIARDGLRTTATFASRVVGMLREKRVTEERGGYPVPAAIREKVRQFILSLDDCQSHEIQYRWEPVRIYGQATYDWRPSR
jgi:hypothetical protein